MPESLLNETDYIVEGEGEVTICELLHSLEGKMDIENVKGIWYKKNGVLKRTPQRPFIQNLDDLPFPARQLLPKEYMNFGHTTISASRGCPFNCSFCQPTLRKLFGPVVRFRSPKNVVDEMEYLKTTFKIKHVKFQDDTFTARKQWVTEVCSEILKRKLKIRWDCNARVNTIDKELLTKMKEAGCTKVEFGVESGSQEILNSLNKGTTIKQIEDAFRYVKKLGSEHMLI